jgi:TonB family protein
VDPWYHDSSGRLRQEGEIELEAVVGTDGRLHEPRVRTGVSPAHERAVLRVLPLWRFEPARRGEEPIAARILLRPVFRIY